MIQFDVYTWCGWILSLILAFGFGYVSGLYQKNMSKKQYQEEYYKQIQEDIDVGLEKEKTIK